MTSLYTLSVQYEERKKNVCGVTLAFEVSLIQSNRFSHDKVK